jgi:hypothetical protein
VSVVAGAGVGAIGFSVVEAAGVDEPDGVAGVAGEVLCAAASPDTSTQTATTPLRLDTDCRTELSPERHLSALHLSVLSDGFETVKVYSNLPGAAAHFPKVTVETFQLRISGKKMPAFHLPFHLTHVNSEDNNSIATTQTPWQHRSGSIPP